LRLFFALWPDADVASRLECVAARLNVTSPGRLVQSKNYHVTLAFIGEVAESKLPVLRTIGESLRAHCCSIAFDSLEFWPESRTVVAVPAEIPQGLTNLWTLLHEATGLPKERLRAHVTLARKMVQAPVLQAMSQVFWQATSFSLVRSKTGGAESTYTVLDTWPLLDET
jgi:RNA 2',3'-cyclic 3'-phosphodiesterase